MCIHAYREVPCIAARAKSCIAPFGALRCLQGCARMAAAASLGIRSAGCLEKYDSQAATASSLTSFARLTALARSALLLTKQGGWILLPTSAKKVFVCFAQLCRWSDALRPSWALACLCVVFLKVRLADLEVRDFDLKGTHQRTRYAIMQLWNRRRNHYQG